MIEQPLFVTDTETSTVPLNELANVAVADVPEPVMLPAEEGVMVHELTVPLVVTLKVAA